MKAVSAKPAKLLERSKPLQLTQAFDFQPPKSVRCGRTINGLAQIWNLTAGWLFGFAS